MSIAALVLGFPGLQQTAQGPKAHAGTDLRAHGGIGGTRYSRLLREVIRRSGAGFIFFNGSKTPQSR